MSIPDLGEVILMTSAWMQVPSPTT
jgi:hypothetical protein